MLVVGGLLTGLMLIDVVFAKADPIILERI
jgi:hypothetical protein